jgi:hypothetical protein
VVEDGARQARVGGRLGKIRSRVVTVVAAKHRRILVHGRRAWESMDMVIVGLGDIRREPELICVLVIGGQEICHGHAILSIHAAVGWQTHVLVRRHTGETKVAAYGCRSRTSLVGVTRI